jgi:hypothetical protein
LKTYGYTKNDAVFPLKFNHTLSKPDCYLGEGRFTFLNLEKVFFDNMINWGDMEYGKLWNYNLQYLDVLNQVNVPQELKKQIVRSLHLALHRGELQLEPYPISLRAINIIGFLSSIDQREFDIEENVFAELGFLYQRLEFHIMGNHLLENAFALVVGGTYFGNRKWYFKGLKILEVQLKEQILNDGAHFELSPMYHQIIFFRVLQLLDMMSHSEPQEYQFILFMKEVATSMRSWLENISFKNGDIPLFNDAAKGIAHTTPDLLYYADFLGVKGANIALNDSGYRSYKSCLYEIKIDMAPIGASYQPGHAHADALSFILYHNNRPLFVEQGTSTYQVCAQRNLERSTQAHNTVVVNDKNQSEVWSGFRVANRARTKIVEDFDHLLKGSHDGYSSWGVNHSRVFKFENDNLIITDRLQGKMHSSSAYFHLFPEIYPIVNGSEVQIGNQINCQFTGAKTIHIERYNYSDRFNISIPAQRIVILFEEQLSTKINFLN